MNPCPKGHDKDVVGVYRHTWAMRPGVVYLHCKQCQKERNARSRPPKGTGGYVGWDLVKYTLDHYRSAYGPSRALEEATTELGMSKRAIQLHLARHPEYQL